MSRKLTNPATSEVRPEVLIYYRVTIGELIDSVNTTPSQRTYLGCFSQEMCWQSRVPVGSALSSTKGEVRISDVHLPTIII